MNVKKVALIVVLLSGVAGLSARTCPPARTTCIDIKEQLAQIRAIQETCCISLNLCLDEINDLCDTYTPACSDTVFIDQAFINDGSMNPITEPGTYCLVEPVVGSLGIDADDVAIEMNGYSISGGTNLISSTNHSNIAIRGFGILRGGSGAGVLCTTCTGVIVQDINFENCPIALEFSGVNTFRVDRCSVIGSTSRGMVFDASQSGKVTCCQLHDNIFLVGVTCRENVQNLIFSDIKVQNNICLTGYQNTDISNCAFLDCCFDNNSNTQGATVGWLLRTSSTCILKNCQAFKNRNNSNFPSVGFQTGLTAKNIIFDSCSAIDNTGLFAYGFRLFGSIQGVPTNCCIKNCLSKGNTTDGFRLENATDCYLSNNIAIDNATGFFWDGNNNNVFLSNYAEANATNYTGVPSVIRFDTSVGEFRDPLNSCTAVSPSDWSNIAIEACP